MLKTKLRNKMKEIRQIHTKWDEEEKRPELESKRLSKRRVTLN